MTNKCNYIKPKCELLDVELDMSIMQIVSRTEGKTPTGGDTDAPGYGGDDDTGTGVNGARQGFFDEDGW